MDKIKIESFDGNFVTVIFLKMVTDFSCWLWPKMCTEIVPKKGTLFNFNATLISSNQWAGWPNFVGVVNLGWKKRLNQMIRLKIEKKIIIIHLYFSGPLILNEPLGPSRDGQLDILYFRLKFMYPWIHIIIIRSFVLCIHKHLLYISGIFC